MTNNRRSPSVASVKLRSHLLLAPLAALLVLGAAGEESTPPRPPEGDIHDKARRLWDAIVHDDPARASDVFFPREPFLQIKNMQDPGRYYDKLRARFDHDIHALHASTPDLDHATFERFELARRGGYVRVREEGNRLPYWASRHSRLHYRVGKQLRALDVRVVIAWEDVWYVIHLSAF
jgi:hypothetical protein